MNPTLLILFARSRTSAAVRTTCLSCSVDSFPSLPARTQQHRKNAGPAFLCSSLPFLVNKLTRIHVSSNMHLHTHIIS